MAFGLPFDLESKDEKSKGGLYDVESPYSKATGVMSQAAGTMAAQEKGYKSETEYEKTAAEGIMAGVGGALTASALGTAIGGAAAGTVGGPIGMGIGALLGIGMYLFS